MNLSEWQHVLEYMANNRHLQRQIDALGFEFNKLPKQKYVIVRKK